jgi:hypothetical protein
MMPGSRGLPPDEESRRRYMEITGRDLVEQEHRTEWAEHRRRLAEAIALGNAEQVKLAKLVAEILKIRQEAERKVWQLDKPVQIERKEEEGHARTRIERVFVPPLPRNP